MSSEITLDEDIADPEKLRPILWQLAETVSRRMKKAGIAGEGVVLKLKTADFRTVTARGGWAPPPGRWRRCTARPRRCSHARPTAGLSG